MTRTIRLSLLAASLVFGTALAATTQVTAAAADATTPTASSYLKTKHEAVQKILKAGGADKDKKVDAELDGLMDFDQMAKDTLGDQWAKRSEPEKKDFTDLLKQLIQKNYKSRLNQTLDYGVSYTSEDVKGTDVIVHTQAQNLSDKREVPTQIDYVLRKKGTGWIVVDLIPEGASMIKTYRKDVTKILDKDGWDAVIKKMKDKLAK